MCQDAPNTSGINAAAVANADIAKQALTWYQQEYARTAPQRDAAAAKANEVADAQLASMKQQNQIAGDYNDYQKATFRPLEQGIVSDAQAYDTPFRREAMARAAAADVAGSFDATRQAGERNLASMGVNPNSGRMQALDRQAGVLQAAASAGAQNQARQQVETQGYARRMDAANLGRNLPSAQAVAAQTGTQAGNAAVGASGQALAAGQSGAALMGQGFNTAMQGNQNAGQLYGQAAGIQGQVDSANSAGTGQAVAGLGMAAAYFF